MVSWQAMVRIAFRIAEQKGGSFNGIEDGGAFMSELATLWSSDKDSIKQMTEAQAESYLRERIEA